MPKTDWRKVPLFDALSVGLLRLRGWESETRVWPTCKLPARSGLSSRVKGEGLLISRTYLRPDHAAAAATKSDVRVQ
jgi:hypothetical protein